MGYHPETLAFSFPPYPMGRGNRVSNALYRLSPWIGFDIWHIDPEHRGTGNRADDSCGWFDRTPGSYSNAVAYILGDATTMHDVSLALARRKHMPMAFYEGISEPSDDPDRARGYPRLTQADCLALVLMISRELELRRWWNGTKGNGGAHASRIKRAFTRVRAVESTAFDLALSSIDNLSSVDKGESMVRLIAAALNRKFRPWWRHPRWHVHHWKINVNLWRNLKRATVERCGTCKKSLGFNCCPVDPGDGSLHHDDCLGIRSAMGSVKL